MSEEKNVFIPKRVVLVTLLNYHLAPNTQKTYMFSAIEEMKEELIQYYESAGFSNFEEKLLKEK